MNPSQEGPHRTLTSFQAAEASSPLDALKAPSVIRPVSTSLLASKFRPDGGLDEIYHEVPSWDGHKGAVFLVSDSPAPGPKEEHPVIQRIYYTMVPQTGSEQFVASIIERFSDSPVPFEYLFTSAFKGQLLTAYPKNNE
jgi:hypothetical protein